MPSSDEQRLLNDVLRNADYAEFRAEVYEMSVAEFKAGRQPPIRALLLAVACVAFVVGIILLSFSTNKELSKKQASLDRPASVESTTDLKIVQSVQLEPAEVVRSVMERSVLLDTEFAGVGAVEFLNSDPATLREMRDAELLALLSDDSLGVMRAKKGESLFYFANAGPPRLE